MVRKLVQLTPENVAYIADLAFRNRGKQCIQGNFSTEINKIVDYYRVVKDKSSEIRNGL